MFERTISELMKIKFVTTDFAYQYSKWHSTRIINCTFARLEWKEKIPKNKKTMNFGTEMEMTCSYGGMSSFLTSIIFLKNYYFQSNFWQTLKKETKEADFAVDPDKDGTVTSNMLNSVIFICLLCLVDCPLKVFISSLHWRIFLANVGSFILLLIYILDWS